MMINLDEVFNQYGKPKGVIHVGGHWAEEHDEYMRFGINQFVYIEPCQEAFNVMCRKFGILDTDRDYLNIGDEIFGIKLFKCACGEIEGELPMYVSHQNQGQSNSLLRPELHLLQHPEIIFNDAEIVKVIPLDDLAIQRERYDFLVMDCQGYEGQVLKGAEETLEQIRIIYTEVNDGQTYKGNMEVDEMDLFLGDLGFERVLTYWPSENWTWGDAVYVRKNK